MKRNKIIIIFLSLGILLLSFIRENTFLVINGALESGNSYKAYLEIPNFLKNFSHQELVVLKYSLSLFVAALMVLFTNGLLKNLFPSKKHLRKVILIYTSALTLSAFFLVLIKFTHDPSPMTYDLSPMTHDLYALSHQLLQLTQSPILPMLLIVFELIQGIYRSNET